MGLLILWVPVLILSKLVLESLWMGYCCHHNVGVFQDVNDQ
jgi:hypothetical protein